MAWIVMAGGVSAPAPCILRGGIPGAMRRVSQGSGFHWILVPLAAYVLVPSLGEWMPGGASDPVPCLLEGERHLCLSTPVSLGDCGPWMLFLSLALCPLCDISAEVSAHHVPGCMSLAPRPLLRKCH